MSSTEFGLVEGRYIDPEQGEIPVWGVWHQDKSRVLYFSEKQMKAQARLLDFTKKRREIPTAAPEDQSEAIQKTRWL
jgi:hypothetical protein